MDIDELFRNKDEDKISDFIVTQVNEGVKDCELLIKAIVYELDNVIEKCIKLNFDVNYTDSVGETPLHCACGLGKITPLKTLIAAGANVNVISKYKITPIMSSAGSGKLNQVKLLLQHGANINGAISAAVSGGYPT